MPKGKPMNNSNSNVFKSGIILGFGLLIPLAVGIISYRILSYELIKLFNPYSEFESSYESYQDREDKNIKEIEIQNYKDIRDGDFVMVLGSIKNTSNKKIGSIKLEAEFYNDSGEFVYEESEYISQRLEPNQVENFAIKCGCSNRKFPEYSKVSIRVTGASSD